MDESDLTQALATLRAKMGGAGTVMLTACDWRFMPASRPMMIQQIDDDGVIWFFAPNDGDLAERIDVNPRVNVTCSDPARGVYVSLSGYARLVFDLDRAFALWDARMETWFPGGPTDARLALLRVDIHEAEYWDAGIARKVDLLSLARAGQTARLGRRAVPVVSGRETHPVYYPLSAVGAQQ